VSVRDPIDLRNQMKIRRLDMAEIVEWQERTATMDMFGHERVRDLSWFVAEARWTERKRVEDRLPESKLRVPILPSRLQNLVTCTTTLWCTEGSL